MTDMRSQNKGLLVALRSQKGWLAVWLVGGGWLLVLMVEGEGERGGGGLAGLRIEGGCITKFILVITIGTYPPLILSNLQTLPN